MHEYGVWTKADDGRPAMRGRTLDAWIRQYNQAVRALDEGVGSLLEALAETGQRNNTLVVYTSDQGFAWGQHGFAWKYAPYDANLRAPLMVRLPGKVAEGKVCRHPVGGIDLIPTFFALAGIPLPWEMHGHDLTSLLADPESSWPYPVVVEQTRATYGSDTAEIPRGKDARWSGVPWYVFLRQDRYKYIRTLEDGEIEELYDLESDPGELRNLAREPEHQQRLAAFRGKLVDELKRTGAPFAGRMPEPRLSPR